MEEQASRKGVQFRKRVYENLVEAGKGYILEYKPISKRYYNYATISIKFDTNNLDLDYVRSVMDTSLKRYIEKFPITTAVFAINENEEDIDEVAQLCYFTSNRERETKWTSFRELSKYNEHNKIGDDFVMKVYESLDSESRESKINELDKYWKGRRNLVRHSKILFIAFPIMFFISKECFFYMSGSASLIYSLIQFSIFALDKCGVKSKEKIKREEEVKKKDDYYYYCERDKVAFNILKQGVIEKENINSFRNKLEEYNNKED